MTEHSTRESGQALVMLLVFMSIIITITSAAVVVTLLSAQATSSYTLGQEALRTAEAGGENALIWLLRDPNYTGETLTTDSGSANITISGISPKLITVEGIVGNMHRKIQTTATYSGGAWGIAGWSEIP